MKMCGTRDAVANLAAEYGKTLIAAGHAQGKPPRLYPNSISNTIIMVHGDGFVVVGRPEKLANLVNTIVRFRTRTSPYSSDATKPKSHASTDQFTLVPQSHLPDLGLLRELAKLGRSLREMPARFPVQLVHLETGLDASACLPKVILVARPLGPPCDCWAPQVGECCTRAESSNIHGLPPRTIFPTACPSQGPSW